MKSFKNFCSQMKFPPNDVANVFAKVKGHRDINQLTGQIFREVS
jgi:hypothetical protein